MRSATSQLTKPERRALAHFYDTETHKALKKLIIIERRLLAEDHVDERDLLQIRYLSGQCASLKKLLHTIKDIYDKDRKSDAS